MRARGRGGPGSGGGARQLWQSGVTRWLLGGPTASFPARRRADPQTPASVEWFGRKRPRNAGQRRRSVAIACRARPTRLWCAWGWPWAVESASGPFMRPLRPLRDAVRRCAQTSRRRATPWSSGSSAPPAPTPRSCRAHAAAQRPHQYYFAVCARERADTAAAAAGPERAVRRLRPLARTRPWSARCKSGWRT